VHTCVAYDAKIGSHKCNDWSFEIEGFCCSAIIRGDTQCRVVLRTVLRLHIAVDGWDGTEGFYVIN